MFTVLKQLGLTKILVTAILLRLLIMPFYFHPDIKTYYFQTSFLKQGVFDIYSYLSKNKETLPLKEEFVYFPATYFFLGSYQTLVSPLLGSGFHSWLFDASQSASNSVGVFRYLFLLKLPYLVVDLAIAFLLLSFFDDAKRKKEIFTLWLLNPFSLVIIYIFSNLDILPVFLTLLSLFFSRQKKFILAAILLGLAAGFKAYPLLLVPFLLLQVDNIRQRAGVLISSLGVFLLIVLPFIRTESFRQAALVSGLTTRMFNGAINLGFGETLMFSIIAIAILFFYKLSDSSKEKREVEHYYFAILLLVYSFIHFHIQWLLWIFPFAMLVIIRKKFLTNSTILLGVVAILIPLLYEDKFMSVSLLAAISPLYNLLPSLFVIVQKFYDPQIVQSILHSILVGGSLIAIWRLFKNQEA